MGNETKRLTSLSGSITRSDRLAYNALQLPLLVPAMLLLLLLKDVIFYITLFPPFFHVVPFRLGLGYISILPKKLSLGF